MTGYAFRLYEQLETFPETIEQELRPTVCKRRQTDRFKENYSIDGYADNIRRPYIRGKRILVTCRPLIENHKS